MLPTQNIKRSHKVLRIMIAVAIITLFFLMLLQTPWNSLSTKQPMGTVQYVNNPWVLSRGDEVIDPELQLPSFRKLEKGELYTVSTTLNYNGSLDDKPYGFLHLDHMYCKVIFDGRVLFNFMPETVHKWDASKSPGYIYKGFALPQDCRGKTLEIQLLAPFDIPIEYGLPDVEFGDYTSMVNKTILEGIPLNVIAVLCFLMGTAAVLFSTFMLVDSKYCEGICIGVFGLLFSLYILTENVLNYYVIANPYYTYLLNYIPFSLLPVSLMGFMRERFEGKSKKLCSWLIAGELLFFAAEMLLHFAGILDMREILPLLHGVYFIQIVLITVLLAGKKKAEKQKLLMLQIMPVLLGMAADALVYWNHWDIGGNDATFTILGVLFFLMIELVNVWFSSVNIYAESARSKLYRKMAFADELTGAGNRRAFDEEIDRIIKKEKTYDSMLVVSVDVNNLKTVNDNYGHASGDYLIQSAAALLMDMAKGRGKVFRTGGDEFVAFLYNTEQAYFESMKQEARQKQELFHQHNQFELSVAMGCVQIYDNEILKAVKAADHKMYIDKAKSKAGREDDRQ